VDERELTAVVIEFLARARRTGQAQPDVAGFVTHLVVWRGWPEDAAAEAERRIRRRLESALAARSQRIAE
jgi:hypothetical protein